MDDFRVTSTSPYAQNPERRNRESGKRRHPNQSSDPPADEDQIVLSHSETVLLEETCVDIYTPSSHEDD